jgi:serine/threonine-protein kinase
MSVLQAPAIVISTLGREQDFTRGFAAGAVDYIEKPFSTEELLARVSVHLSKASSARLRVVKLGFDLPEENGLVFGRYRIERELGEGGFGRVFLATDTGRAGTQVALKVLMAPLGDERDARARFMKESYMLSKVASRAVAAVYDVGEYQEQLYLAMEFVSGETLQERVVGLGPLGESEATTLTYGLLEGLTAVEAAGVLHRDLKPLNVILRDGDVRAPVIVDFGLAKRPHDRGMTLPNVIVGTLTYLPPEVLLSEVPDHRSDLYSLGLTVRFAVEGREIFPEFQGMALLEAIMKGPIPAPTAPLTPSFAAFLKWLVETKPAARPTSVAEALRFLATLK